MFLDESGFSLVPSVQRTWAPRGQTPILTTAGSWSKISAISAISVSPQRKRINLYIRLHPKKNIRWPEVIEFLKHLKRHLPKGFVLLWDGGMPHKATETKQWLKEHSEVRAFRFPAYSPELNPDEWVWNHLKRSVANGVPADLKILQDSLSKPVRRLQRSSKLLWSCIHASKLPWN